MKLLLLLITIPIAISIKCYSQAVYFTTQPQWSPDGEKILFWSKKDENQELYVIDKDGSNQQRLTNTPQNESQPKWSPNGEKILFRSEKDGIGQLFIMNADGSGRIKLTRYDFNEFDADWSPSGHKIAFSSSINTDDQIYIVNPDGTGLQRLTNTKTNITQPIWSSEGTSMMGFSVNIWDNLSSEYLKINVLDATAKPMFKDSNNPVRFYSFLNDSKKMLCAIKEGNYASIYIANLSLNEKVKISSEKIHDLLNASLSPDGETLLYSTTKKVFTQKIGEEEPIRIGEKHHYAQWSPDGKLIVMTSKNGEELFTVKPDGTQLKKLFPAKQ